MTKNWDFFKKKKKNITLITNIVCAWGGGYISFYTRKHVEGSVYGFCKYFKFYWGVEFLQEYVLCEVPKGFVMILMSIH